LSATATRELHLYDLHPIQQRIRAEARRFNVVALGRRTGKTTLAGDLVVETTVDDRGPCAYFAPTYKNLGETWRELKTLLGPVATRVSESDNRIEVLGGGSLDCWSLDSERVAETVRGRKYKRVLIDEASLVAALLDTWQTDIRPMLTDLRGDAWFFGTPKGLNDFWALYERGQDPLATDWASWRAPTAANPFIDPQEIRDARAELPEEAFAQEYLAEFLSQGVGVFREVVPSMTATVQQAPVRGHGYVFGVDWGQVDDFTVISVLDTTTREQVAGDRFNRIEYHFQTARLAILAHTFRPRLIVAERNSIGLPMLERLQEMDLPVWGWDATNATVAAGVQSLSLGLQRRQLRLLPDAHPLGRVQKTELLAYTASKTATGLLKYGAPPGMHDDAVRALMLSWLGALTADARPTQRDFRVVA
jgi:hypothetical protein